jgi:NAD(P)H-flavin reductase
MLKTTFTLKQKNILTHDVFELIYSCPDINNEYPKPGQYVMFQLAPWLNRAYSFASYRSWEFTLIIKRIAHGKGSPIICDAEVGSVFTGLLPLGHFVLQNTAVPKCFIWTGTGFAPLYCMVLDLARESDFQQEIAFLYGVREQKDSFYREEMKELSQELSLSYYPFLSGDSQEYATSGYVTDWITEENIASFQEFYICGSPAMVKSAREKLETLWIKKESIFFEPY